ncbi:hypothetical protein R3P38DRAFT_2995213 [Favolaschia claudopus]|uniref:Uncharacterized protein n=1 Tax=Favolaschia claudopus TaxID=2862362 RepID=A0AAW0AU60_9AGAR
MSTHKRKRSLSEDPVSTDQLHYLKKHTALLREELEGIEETETELETVMQHIINLERLLSNVKKPRYTFSSMTKKDLTRLGVKGQMLVFKSEGLATILGKSNDGDTFNEEVSSLRTRLIDIYAHVNMDYEAGSRMLLDAVLLSIAKISSKRDPETSVAILPEMRLTSSEGTVITNPESKFQAWLTGNVDYGVIRYLDQDDNKARFIGVDASRDGILHLAAGHLFLVEAKRMSDKGLSQHMPEAVGQAMALSEITGSNKVRFCLSNGHSWIFAILLKDEAGNRSYYESTPRYLDKSQTESDLPSSLQHIGGLVALVLQWLSPTDSHPENQLFTLKNWTQ